MHICVFHSNLNVKNPTVFGIVHIMYAKHFPDTQLCPVSKRITLFTFLMACGLLPIFYKFVPKKKKKYLLAEGWDSKPVQIISAW